MLPTQSPVKTKSWKKLAAHAATMKNVHMRDLFASDEQRFEKYTLRHGDILFDYSKNRITDKTLELLFDLAKESKVADGIKAMFSGEIINKTEHRSVLHTALRYFGKDVIESRGENVLPEVRKVQRKMKAFADAVHTGKHLGYTGKK